MSENESEDEREELRDPEVLTNVIRRRVLRALVPVVKKLDRVARGLSGFRNDAERQACVALARLAPALLVRPEPDPYPGYLGYHPSHTPEQAAALLRKLQARRAARERGEQPPSANDNGS